MDTLYFIVTILYLQTINYTFCINKLLICCLLMVSKVVVKFRYWVGLIFFFFWNNYNPSFQESKENRPTTKNCSRQISIKHHYYCQSKWPIHYAKDPFAEHYKLDYIKESQLLGTDNNTDHLSVRAGDEIQMIYFQETIWLNYTCSARSDTGNVATVSITRDRHRKLQNRIKIPHGIAPHLKCACCILQSHRPKWVPPVAKETQSSSRLASLPSAPPPPFNMWTSGLSMTWNKSRWKNTTVIGARAAPCQSSRPRIKCQRRRGGACGTAGACLKWASPWLLCMHTHWFAHYNADPSRSPRAGTETQA